MSTPEGKTRIAAIADIHVRETDKGKWIELFRQASRQADILLICGDLTNTGDEAEAEVLKEELKTCAIPVIAVLGNHDHEKGRHKTIRQIIQSENVHILDGEAIAIGNVGFAGIKGFGGGFDNYMLSMFGESAMKAFVQEAVNDALNLDRALARLDQQHENLKKVALLHYSPIQETVKGEPEQIFPFLGSSRLAEPLTRRQVIAVFHGHAHAGTLEGTLPGGGHVYNVAQPVLAKAAYPHPFFLLEL
ncbi:MAG TPA: metallophosphoesterase [Puia sp.]|jgi:Icc-related predicted phosphoesterase|nr:metallophosphoesterase [Puia sp.]